MGYSIVIALVFWVVDFVSGFTEGFTDSIFKAMQVPLIFLKCWNISLATAADFLKIFNEAAMAFFFLQWEATANRIPGTMGSVTGSSATPG